jgi:hypothetical protein
LAKKKNQEFQREGGEDKEKEMMENKSGEEDEGGLGKGATARLAARASHPP